MQPCSHQTRSLSSKYTKNVCGSVAGVRRQSMTLQVVHLASESGIEFMAPISGAVSGECVKSLINVAHKSQVRILCK